MDRSEHQAAGASTSFGTGDRDRRDGSERRVEDERVAEERRVEARRAADIQRREAAERRRYVLGRVGQGIDYLFYLLYGLLAVRFMLSLLGANEQAGFVSFIRSVTGPFYAPFDGIVGRPSIEGGGFVDLPLIVALLAYLLLHGAVRGLLHVMAGTKNRAVPVVLATAAAACAAGPLPAQQEHDSDHHPFRTVTVVEGLEHPWGLAFLPNGDMLVTERPGRLRVVSDGQLRPEPVQGVPEVFARGQGGMLDVALHPDFESNQLVYLSFSKPGPDNTATTAVVRGRFDGARLNDVEEIFEADAYRDRGQHYGSRLAFDRDGYLYVTVGDRGHNPHTEDHDAQNLSNHPGSVQRLHDDGRVPEDNPFVDRDGAQASIFTYGNRNPQALAVHPETGQIWATEHGARGGDELNLLQPGRNYGWPVITHGVNYSGQEIGVGREAPGMEQPVSFWVPSIATSGMAFYTGDRFPSWSGDLFVGGLAGQQLVRLRLDGTEVVEREVVLEEAGRVRDVRVGPDGLIYLLIDAAEGRMIRLEPAG